VFSTFGASKPSAARHIDAPTDVGESVRRMGVDRHDERNPARPRRTDPAWLEVETMRVAVHLDRDPRLGGRIEHRLDVACERRPREDVAAERVPPDLEQRVPHRATSRRVISRASSPWRLWTLAITTSSRSSTASGKSSAPSRRMSLSVPRSRRMPTRAWTCAISSHCRRSRSTSRPFA
jgi:hypothetical protein